VNRENELVLLAKVIGEMYRNRTVEIITPDRTAKNLIDAGFGYVKDRYEIGQTVEVDGPFGKTRGHVCVSPEVGSVLICASSKVRAMPNKRKKEPEEVIAELFHKASKEGACKLFTRIANGECYVDIAKEYWIDLETEV
jgi:hypothetical protein